jgi:hypothetical protein
MNVIRNAKPVAQTVAAIHALDLESVKSRVMDAELGEGWSREYANSVETAYKTYLTMLVKYPDDSADIMLATDVDEFWHTHILQTVKYTEDCEHVFGFYLHHYPHVGERNAEDMAKREALAAKTRQLYEREFGGDGQADAAWAGELAARNVPAHIESEIVLKRDIAANKAAFSSGPGIVAQTAAFSSGPGIAAQNAAFSSGPGITARNAAFSSGPGINAKNAAFSSGPGISARNAAFSSGPGINAENAAFSSGPGITAKNAAFSSGPGLAAIANDVLEVQVAR